MPFVRTTISLFHQFHIRAIAKLIETYILTDHLDNSIGIKQDCYVSGRVTSIIPINDARYDTITLSNMKDDLVPKNKIQRRLTIVTPLSKKQSTNGDIQNDVIKSKIAFGGPLQKVLLFVAAVIVLRELSFRKIQMPCDFAFLLVFIALCLGMHLNVFIINWTCSNMQFINPTEKSSNNSSCDAAISVSPSSAHGSDDDGSEVCISATSFRQLHNHDESSLSIEQNVWTIPKSSTFFVRGKNYFCERKKIESGPFLFPVRGVDLFLTDTCPRNVGRNSALLGGELRDKPTFIVNFQLPWGVLLMVSKV